MQAQVRPWLGWWWQAKKKTPAASCPPPPLGRPCGLFCRVAGRLVASAAVQEATAREMAPTMARALVSSRTAQVFAACLETLASTANRARGPLSARSWLWFGPSKTPCGDDDWRFSHIFGTNDSLPTTTTPACPDRGGGRATRFGRRNGPSRGARASACTPPRARPTRRDPRGRGSPGHNRCACRSWSRGRWFAYPSRCMLRQCGWGGA